jgi:hypothetical protein
MFNINCFQTTQQPVINLSVSLLWSCSVMTTHRHAKLIRNSRCIQYYTAEHPVAVCVLSIITRTSHRPCVQLRRCIYTSEAFVYSYRSNTTCFGQTDCHHQNNYTASKNKTNTTKYIPDPQHMYIIKQLRHDTLRIIKKKYWNVYVWLLDGVWLDIGFIDTTRIYKYLQSNR